MKPSKEVQRIVKAANKELARLKKLQEELADAPKEKRQQFFKGSKRATY